MIDFKKLDNESETDYICRITQNKGMYTWQELADGFNKALHYNYCESRYRKIYNTYLQNQLDTLAEDEETMPEYLKKKIELDKTRVKARHERNAFNLSIRNETMREYLGEIVSNEIARVKPYEVIPFKCDCKAIEEKDFIICLNDIHYGIDFKNYWNTYNPEVAKLRLEKYLRYIKEAREIFKPRNCFLTLGGDNISGNIHYTIALENRENVVKQIVGVSELISWFTASLSALFEKGKVTVIGQAGNHSRLNPNKALAPRDERLDDLIPWYLRAKTANLKNVSILDYSIDNTFSVFTVRGKNYLLVHGDYDHSKSVHRVLEMLPKDLNINTIFFAHNHHNSLAYRQGQRVIASGSIMGMDSFCIEKRIVGKAQQMICIVDDEGVQYVRDCNLQEV